jgi:BRCT domain type II-containing protein
VEQGRQDTFSTAAQRGTTFATKDHIGWNTTSSLNGSISDIIVAGENPGGKLQDADDRHVTVLDEDACQEFIDPTAQARDWPYRCESALDLLSAPFVSPVA